MRRPSIRTTLMSILSVLGIGILALCYLSISGLKDDEQRDVRNRDQLVAICISRQCHQHCHLGLSNCRGCAHYVHD